MHVQHVPFATRYMYCVPSLQIDGFELAEAPKGLTSTTNGSLPAQWLSCAHYQWLSPCQWLSCAHYQRLSPCQWLLSKPLISTFYMYKHLNCVVGDTMSKHGGTPGMLLTEVAVFNLPEVVALLVTKHLIHTVYVHHCVC